MGSTSLLFLGSPSISHPKSKDTRSVNTADSISSSIPGTKLTCTPPNATATRARHCHCQCVVSSWRSGRGRCPLGYGDERTASRSRSHGVHTHRIVSRRIPAYGTRMPNRPQARCHWSSQPACCSRARYLLGSWSLRADPPFVPFRRRSHRGHGDPAPNSPSYSGREQYGRRLTPVA